MATEVCLEFCPNIPSSIYHNFASFRYPLASKQDFETAYIYILHFWYQRQKRFQSEELWTGSSQDVPITVDLSVLPRYVVFSGGGKLDKTLEESTISQL